MGNRFGTVIQRELTRRGWTLRDLAVLVEASPSQIQRVVRGERPLRLDLAQRICNAFGKNLTMFEDGKWEEPKEPATLPDSAAPAPDAANPPASKRRKRGCTWSSAPTAPE